MKRDTEDMNEMTQTNTTQINPLGTEPVGQQKLRSNMLKIIVKYKYKRQIYYYL